MIGGEAPGTESPGGAGDAAAGDHAHRPSLVVSTVESAQAVSAGEWERLAVRRSFYLSRQWLSAVEQDTAFTSRYLLARDGTGRLVGALPVYLWKGVGGVASAYYDTFQVFFSHLVPDARRAEWFPTLLVGSRSGYANQPLLNGALAPAARQAVLATLLDRALGLADELDARSVAMLYLDRRSLDEWIGHVGDAKILLTNADANLAVNWDSFDGYLGSLTSDHRKKARREVRTFGELAPPASRVRFSSCYSEAARLTADLQQRYGHGESEAQLRGFFEAQVTHLDDHSQVFVCREESELRGFALFYDHEDALYARVCGFDSPRERNDFMYFNLGYYEPIRYAAASRRRSLALGTGSWKTKVLRGATLEPLWSVLFRPKAIDRTEWPAMFPRWNQYAYRRWHQFAASLRTELAPSSWRLEPDR
ncbi:MAG TPA: peptidogalycan biosysnthesis protein [Solirubrobacteraceae bacterium]|jgi:predicted N-acyltransferase